MREIVKVGVRQIVRAATGSAKSHAHNARHWASGRQAAAATLLNGRLSPASQESLWHLHDFLGRAKKHGWPGAAIASLLVGVTIAVELLVLHGEKGDDQTRGAVITVLGTVVTFFAVSTLAVSVSLSLLQTAAGMWPARVIDSIFTKDHDREFLLQTIYAAFLVSLANLSLLTTGVVHPLLALVVPVLAAFLTLMLMVAYVFERVLLFSSRGLIDEIQRTADHQIGLLGDGHSDPHEARLQAMARVFDIFEVTLALIKDQRGEDAEVALEEGFQLMERLLEKQTSPGIQGRLRARPKEDPRDGWERELYSAIKSARSASAGLDVINVDPIGRRHYYYLLADMLRRVSGIILVDLGNAHFDSGDHSSSAEIKTLDQRTMAFEEMEVLGALAYALMNAPESTDADDNQEKSYLLQIIENDACNFSFRIRQGLADDGTTTSVGAVDAIGTVHMLFSSDVLALPEFSKLSLWLEELETDLSPEQSAMLEHWHPRISFQRQREAVRNAYVSLEGGSL